MSGLLFRVESNAELRYTATGILAWATDTFIESNGKFQNILCNDVGQSDQAAPSWTHRLLATCSGST